MESPEQNYCGTKSASEFPSIALYCRLFKFPALGDL
jgi:hypothetical protein